MITDNEEKIGITETVEETERRRGDERLEYLLYRGEKNGRESFSIQVIQYKEDNETCRATACDVSSRYEAAKYMFDAVSGGFIEPYILCDVIYDLLP